MIDPVKFLFLALLALLVANANADGDEPVGHSDGHEDKVVTYDGRSMIINGSRELLFSGSIHYPRSTVEMWPELIKLAKEGGLNLIQTYVFWNIHEPVQGQFDFEGNYDLVKFIKMIGDNGLWVTLRLGPYIESEWNLGGFPYWLKEIPDIIFRSYNEPFMFHMKKYSEMVIDLMKKEKLFADQGGPIIMAQIENEYNNAQLAYRENGVKYIKWAGDMAVGLYNGVLWIMCKQKKHAPDTVISTCNGRHCADTFAGPNGPNKPSLWTENWTAQYRVFGDPPSQRSAEDLAYAVAKFFARNGTLNNYYMITTYEKDGGKICAAFLINNNSRVPATVEFRGDEYYLPAKSVSILPDCKTVVFNSQAVVAQHSSRNSVLSKTSKFRGWEMWRESIPTHDSMEMKNVSPNEHYTLTKDTSDYAWYSTSIYIDREDLGMPCLPLSMANMLYEFSIYIGFGHGSNVDKRHVLKKPVTFKAGNNNISMLAMTVGLPNSGAYMERRFAGPKAILVQGLMSGTLDISRNGWTHQVGLNGEKMQLFTEQGAKQAYFDAPEGKDPVALRMTSMQKGFIWVNGINLGRYWISYLSAINKPTQEEFESWERKDNKIREIFDPVRAAHLTCPDDKIIGKVEFVSFGESEGACGAFSQGKCDSPMAHNVVEELCLGKNGCTIPFDRESLIDGGEDSCPDVAKRLAVQVACI
ncbi:hypothetical protein SASPL_148258 [Salvia splendens]|uniref:Beta-galactosidase n=1 Tax=Salvia splendens TaxID=180675 RepID=A0A8X8W9E7_SALSN|nr:hypothetical protein SASPL_148258 [Salvia splendens]